MAPVRAIDRALRIMEAVAENRSGVTVPWLNERTGLPLSTVYRVVETLRARGYLSEVGSDGRYTVGHRAFQVGAAYSALHHLPDAARPAMQRLVEELGETVNLGVMDGDKAIYLDQMTSNRMMRTFVEVGAEAPLHCSGVGKALLAWQEPAKIERLLAGELRPYTDRTLVRVGALASELDRIRAAGYAVDDEEREVGVRCVAVPVFDAAGRVVAALSVSGPASRIKRGQVAQIGGRLRQVAREVSQGLA